MPEVNAFAWYVYFYVFCMFALPLIEKCSKKKPWAIILLLCVIFSSVEVILYAAYESNGNIITGALAECLFYFPCVLIGFFCSTYRVFERIEEKSQEGIIIDVAGIFAMILIKRLVNHFIGGRGIGGI